MAWNARSAKASSAPKKPRRPILYNSSACDQCFRRKLRCDSGRPACERCSACGSSCTYIVDKPASSRTNDSTSSISSSASSAHSPYRAETPSLHGLDMGGAREASQPYEQLSEKDHSTIGRSSLQQGPHSSEAINAISVNIPSDLLWLDSNVPLETQMPSWNYSGGPLPESLEDIASTATSLSSTDSPSWMAGGGHCHFSAAADATTAASCMPPLRYHANPEVVHPSALSAAQSASTFCKWSADVISSLDDVHLWKSHPTVDKVVTHTQRALDMVRSCVREQCKSPLSEDCLPQSTIADILGCIMIIKQVLACYLALRPDSSNHHFAGMNTTPDRQNHLSEHDPDESSARILSVIVAWGLQQCRDLAFQIEAWSTMSGLDAAAILTAFLIPLRTAIQSHIE